MMLWYEMSWPEIAAVDRNVPVVVPLGSCEQHAHHLPVSVDTIQVETIARDVEAKMEQRILLTPTLWLGSSHHHKDFVGTISVTPMLYAQIVQQIAGSILRAGFSRILFLNGHGGNRVPGGAGLSELTAIDDHADGAHIALANWWEIAADQLAVAGIKQQTVGHACEYETSLMLEIRSDLVRMDKVQAQTRAMENEWYRVEGDNGTKVTLYHRFHRLSASGLLGDSAAASKEKGARLRAAVASEIVRFLTDFSGWPDARIHGPR
jgi:creatinine amidohydrolase